MRKYKHLRKRLEKRSKTPDDFNSFFSLNHVYTCIHKFWSPFYRCLYFYSIVCTCKYISIISLFCLLIFKNSNLFLAIQTRVYMCPPFHYGSFIFFFKLTNYNLYRIFEWPTYMFLDNIRSIKIIYLLDLLRLFIC